MSFTFYKQLNAMDCGPTCLRMVSKYYGRHFNTDTLRQQSGFSKQGVSLLGISETAENIGFRTRGVRVSYKELLELPIPCILHWDQGHFVVLTEVSEKKVRIADPASGMIGYSSIEFLSHWAFSEKENGEQAGFVLLLEPTPLFYETIGEKEEKLSWRLVMYYLTKSKWRIAQVFIALLISSLLQLLFPLLTQSVVDKGISSHNLHFVMIILIAQLTLTFSQTIVNFIRSRLLLRISNALNLQILSDFWMKLTRLPVSYFDLHHTGDTIQRIEDHNRIQAFLTGPALETFFSIFNFMIYAILLMTYNVNLFLIFIFGSIIYLLWVKMFLAIRRKINYETFHLSSKENSATLQLIQGMQEIRLNNAEKQKRWDWEDIQSAIFKLRFKNLNYSQWQTSGATLINQIQNITISFFVAKLVIDEQLTLGAMLAIQYIIGQLSGPISQLVTFVQSAQDAKISMERLNEIHQLKDEEDNNKIYVTQLPANKSIQLNNLSFAYPGAGNELVLDDICLHIPQGKMTAIVGASGSGKTTLLKILLKIYDQYDGEISIGNSSFGKKESSKIDEEQISFDIVSPSYWRQLCGAVLQDGYIFNDSIEKNIAVSQNEIDYERLNQSCNAANISSYIASLPNGFHTQLGADGTGLSQGQKQRILIARSIYKNPEYFFFDEATNSLDANNEVEIIANLNKIFKGKTVVVVAHRLSTVKNANKIVVLHKGKIVEEGTHEFLISTKSKYFELVKNQMELGM